MTCSEFRNMTARPIHLSTRGERSAGGKHIQECQACREFIEDAGTIPDDDPRAAVVDQLLAEDRHDPEWE